MVGGGVASDSYLRDRYATGRSGGARYLDADGSRLASGAFVLNASSQDPISLIFSPPELWTGRLVLSILRRSLVAEGSRQHDDCLGTHAPLRRR